MYAAARALKSHGDGAGVQTDPLTLNEVAFRRPNKKDKIKPPAYATTYFLKTYYNRNKEANLSIIYHFQFLTNQFRHYGQHVVR